MGIIEFIMDNFAFVLIFISLLIGILNKGKPGKQGKTQSMPPFGGEPAEPSTTSPKSVPSAERTRRTAVQPGQRDEGAGRSEREGEPVFWSSNTDEENQGKLAGDGTASYNREETALPVNTMNSVYSLQEIGAGEEIVSGRSREVATGRKQPNKEINQQTGQFQTNVVQGMIWSEILGPPRAKKPFRR